MFLYLEGNGTEAMVLLENGLAFIATVSTCCIFMRKLFCGA